MTAILTHPADTRTPVDRAAPVLVAPHPEHAPAGTHRSGNVQSAEVYRRRRLVVLALVFSMLVGVWSYGCSSQSSGASETRSFDAGVVVVKPGDTLWSIATWLDPGADPRRLVAELRELAGSAVLRPGQRLVIPAELIK